MGIYSFAFPSSVFYLHLCFRCRLNSTRLCYEAMVYTMCRDHCLSSKPGDKTAAYNGCCEMPAVRTAVALSKSKHLYCNNNNNVSVHFKAKESEKKKVKHCGPILNMYFLSKLTVIFTD